MDQKTRVMNIVKLHIPIPPHFQTQTEVVSLFPFFRKRIKNHFNNKNRSKQNER